jgi:hypothetical protein
MTQTKLTQQQREYMLKAIYNSFELVIFQHEQDALETMMARYVNPANDISDLEVRDDLIFLEKLTD